MPVFLSILRGINVSGQKMIKMPELVKLYQELGCKNISTYIQSGNVIFDIDDADQIAEKISKKILERFKFEVPVLIRTKDEMNVIIGNNPFLKDTSIDFATLHITYLAKKPDVICLEKIMNLDSGQDKLYYQNKELYLHCPNGYGRTKLNNNFLENKLNVAATTRNWRTVSELTRLMNDH